jgi:hypothetical protein
MSNKDLLLSSEGFNNTLEKIRQYFIDDNIKLSQKEDEIRIRLESAFTLLCKYHSNEQAKDRLISQFNYTPRQAYRDIRSALELFGDVIKTKKEASRYILYELAMKNYQLAASKSDIDQMNRAVANLIKITGVDREDIDLPDPSKIQPPMQMLSITIQFINSPFFKQIDKKAQEQVLELQNKIQGLIDKSPIKDYLDMMNISDAEIIPDGN